MNKIIPFNKDIPFNDRIGEIMSIALEDNIIFSDSYTIKGELVVRGCHKFDELEEEFSYPIPIEITVDTKYNTEKASISVDDFYYEIINENILHVKINLLLDNLTYQEEPKEVREVKIVEEIKEEKEEPKEEKDVLDLFKETPNEEKTYSIYRVYVVLENDTLDNILTKYQITKEELEEFNDLSNLKVGTKLIIPSLDE